MNPSHNPPAGITHEGLLDVIVVGGSFAGLAAAMALGRALRRVLVIDGGQPCNRQTPFSHNFITQDGKPPSEITALAKAQVEQYPGIRFLDGFATRGYATEGGFAVETDSGAAFRAKKLIIAAGIKDDVSTIPGMAEAWGISVLHCPYCHGYEVKGRPTGVLGNGGRGFEFAALIANWTSDLVLLTNGDPTLSDEQERLLRGRGIGIVRKGIAALEQLDGKLRHVVFDDGAMIPLDVLYVRPDFVQHSTIPESLGCELSADGYIKTGQDQMTTVEGVYACGDNSSSMRTVANAVASGTTAGMMASKALAIEELTTPAPRRSAAESPESQPAGR